MPSAGSKTAGGDAAPRYEFRIWAASLTAVRERLEKLSGPQPAEQSRETYIVSDATNDTNAKIRAGVIDIKVLLRINQNLEQWKPYLKADFPIDAALIAEKIFPALHVDPPELRRQPFTAEVFVNTVVKNASPSRRGRTREGPPPVRARRLRGGVRRSRNWRFGPAQRRRRVHRPAGRPGRRRRTRDRGPPECQLRAADQIDARTRLARAFTPPADADRARAEPPRRPRRAR